MENKRIKILAIDDNKDDLIVIKALVKEAFPYAETLTALSGKDGVELASSNNPDVILLDIIMPEMDGFEVCLNLKSDKKLRDIPVVFITAYKSDKESRTRALECGAEAFLTKPFDLQELKAQIRSMVKIKNANIAKDKETEKLELLVEQRTNELKVNYSATLNLMDDIQKEIEARKKSEAALKESEKKYRLITEKISDVVWNMDLNGKSLFVSPSIERFTGYTVDEYLNQSITDRFTPESSILALEIFKSEVFRYSTLDGPPKDYKQMLVLDYLCKDGSVKTGEVLVTPDFNENNICVGLYGVTRDITERKLAEVALINSEESLDIAQEIANMGSWEFDVLNKKLVWSKNFYCVFGYKPYEIEPSYDLFISHVNPDDLYLIKEAEEFVMRTQKPITQELRFITKNGNLIWIQNQLVPIIIENVVVKFKGVSTDITERKLAIAELEESREKYRGLSEATFESIFISEKGVCIEQNQTAEKIFGYTTEEAIGRYGTEWIVPEDRELVMNNMLRGYELPYESTAITKDGRKFPCVLRSKMMFYKGKHVRVTSLTDITERKLAEKALRESEEKYFNLYTLMRLMSDTMPDMLWAKDLNNRFIFANKAVCEKLLNAVDTDEPIGKDDYYFAFRERKSHPDNPEWYTFGELCVNSDEITKKEMKQMQFDEFGNVKGKFLYLDVNKAPLFNDKNEFIGLVGSARDVTYSKIAEKALQEKRDILKKVLFSSSELIDLSPIEIDYKKVTDFMLEMSGAKYAVYNLFDESGLDFTTVAVSGLSDVIKKASYYLGFDLTNKKWKFDPVREGKIKNQTITVFDALHKLTGNVISSKISIFLEKTFNVGEVAVVKISKNNIPIGDFTLIFERGKSIKNAEIIELFVNQVGLFTMRKRAEEALNESERLLRESQSVAHIGSFAWDFSTGIWKSSAVLDEIFGIDKDYIRTLDGWADIVHPDWKDIMLDYVTNSVIGKYLKFDKEYQIIRKNDGEIRWLHGFAELEFDEKKNAVKLIGTIIDITERKQKDDEIKKIGQHYQALIEKAPDGIVLLNSEGHFKYVSPSAKKNFWV
ncbi:MAG: PAS domain S-box protein [Bacteroidota bacterium]